MVAITITSLSICSFLAKPSVPVVLSPGAKGAPQEILNFTCTSHGFSPSNITVKWFKDGNELSDIQTTVKPEENNNTYSVLSTVQVVVNTSEVKSEIICEVAHVTLQGSPLRRSAILSHTTQGK